MSTLQMIELQALAAKCDMRVGQLISNAIEHEIDVEDEHDVTFRLFYIRLFYIRDDELVRICREFVSWYLAQKTLT